MIITGPATWTGFCQNASTFQSPIDIPYDYDHLHKVNDWLPIQWIHYGNFMLLLLFFQFSLNSCGFMEYIF